MPLPRRAIRAWHVLILATTASAQTTSTNPSTNPSTSTTSTTSPSSVTANPPPASSSGIPGNGDNSNGGLSTYYLVGLILLLCCIGMAVFFMCRRKALSVRNRRRNGNRTVALEQDLRAGGSEYPLPGSRDPLGRPNRYSRGMRRGVDDHLEDGLNEHGEAPPLYIPKNQWEELQRNDETRQPAIPLQTLARDDVGLKPPDYSETVTSEVGPNARNSTTSASSSRAAEHRANP